MSPRFTSGSPNCAALERHDEVARQHQLHPAADRVALDRGDQRLRAVPPDQADLAAREASDRRCRPPRSAPAEKTIAVPVSTPHHSSGSSSSSFIAESTRAVISALSALRFSSRWIEITEHVPDPLDVDGHVSSTPETVR